VEVGDMSEQQLDASERIVVGVDGSESSKAALRWAARIASAIGARIEAVIAWDYPSGFAGPVYVEMRPDLDAETIVQDTLAEVFGPQRPPGLTVVVRQGPARNVLLDASAGAEMLVVGSRGHGGFVGLLLGSVSAACAEHAHCPVVIVHGTPA
jgi:nucleotide-binding universal stress UspA family protein